MRFTQVAALLSTSATASAQLTYNITQASASGNREKYCCLDNAKLSSQLPECLHECQVKANNADGCAPDDFVCHCVNYTVYSDLIEPCAFPAALGGQGTCTLEELAKARPIINDMCNFFNATLYADYVGCPQKLSKEKTYGIVHNEQVIVSY
ncbi:hypothetical protein DDE82_002125 [Stemphylium lycopersici]|uniref:CFEM domain-containing protein n=1 Tax=Stemphylium lycopersici TaxID=183478 RepID=A0A364NFU7_STELY|nr:hypothetical protein TW65_04690 [Stemphylium lycopersici]RAR08835.1 hypothetical protein DDE82_002125 [Stemphylium lycopersici]RAR15983.1 hypothetical protein DDE83_000557 [Stemphylium lycopersici]